MREKQPSRPVPKRSSRESASIELRNRNSVVGWPPDRAVAREAWASRKLAGEMGQSIAMDAAVSRVNVVPGANSPFTGVSDGVRILCAGPGRRSRWVDSGGDGLVYLTSSHPGGGVRALE